VLFSFMGSGCRSVRTICGENIDLIVGTWDDGRVGTVRAFRTEKLKQFGCTVATDSDVYHALGQKEPPYYALMLREIMEFFQTRTSPIDLDETVEIMGFLESADRSKQQSSRPIKIRL
jgi:hypothetical protein